MTVSFDQEELRSLNMFESLAEVEAKDCVIAENYVYFVVSPSDMAQAIGKGGRHVKELQNQLNKKVQIVEHDDTIPGFVENITNVPADNVTTEPVEEGTNVIIHTQGADNVRRVPEELLKRLLGLEHSIHAVEFTR